MVTESGRGATAPPSSGSPARRRVHLCIVVRTDLETSVASRGRDQKLGAADSGCLLGLTIHDKKVNFR
jgi:hypothetical protein